MENKKMNRRNFIGTGLIGAASVSVGKTFASNQSQNINDQSRETDIYIQKRNNNR